MRQSNRVGEAEAVALHGGHPGGSGKSPSTKGFPHGPVLRGRQSKDILFWCGSSSGCRLQRRRCRVQRAACRVDAGCRVQGAECVQGACRAGRAATVRDPATGVPSLFRRSASFVKKRNPQSAGPCEAVAVGHGARAVRWVRPLSRQGISTACPLGTDLGMSGSSSASKGGAGRGQGADGAGRGRLFGARDGACCTCVREGRRRAKAVHSPAAVGAGWTEGPEERGRGCGAAPGERAEEG